jgi:hypothetical protein
MSYNSNNLYPKPAYSANAVVADQRLTVDSTAGGVQFTAFATPIVNFVMFDVQTADVMCTIDGSAPTTTNGHRLYAGTFYTWSVAMANAAKFIAATATSGAIQASPLQM